MGFAVYEYDESATGLGINQEVIWILFGRKGKKRMKKKMLRSIICFLLAVIMITECNLGAFVSYASEVAEDNYDEEEEGDAESEEEFIPTGSSYLYPFEEAVIALEELVAQNPVQGVIYLADEVTMRALPEEESEPVKNLPSGSVVNILSVGQDAGYQIWYRVSYTNEYEEVTGYVPHDYMVCVNPDFMQWQENYVRSISMFGNLRGSYTPTDISAFPKSYQQGLLILKEKHPNWIFVRLNTNVNWETMLREQQRGNRSWISNYKCEESWKAGPASQEGWSLASRGIIRYYMDPRNWFNEEYVFQFELLGYEPQLHTEAAVEKLLANSFMSHTMIDDKMTYAQAFIEIGRAADINPMFLAARVIQEQGYQGDSALISGKYPGYENLYNYFNIQASEGNTKETIENGLKYAEKMGWNTRYKSLEAGIGFLLTGYIKVGQNTLYLQKFDTVGEIATHQYMQNIKAPAQESSTVYKGYKNSGLLSQSFVFIIPVYENMPEKAAAKPGQEDKITLSTTVIDNLQVNSEVTLQPLVNGKVLEDARFEFSSSNLEVAKVDEKGTVKALKAGETTIACKDMDDPENPNIGTCKVTVVPADIDPATLELPELETVTYDPNKTLKDVKLPEGYTWVNSEIIPCVNQTSYAVVYSPNEEKYKPITLNLTLEVKKRVLTIADCTLPTELVGAAGKELASVGLPAGFNWKDATELLPDTIGTKQYLVSYNPDSANYETLEDIKVTVTIVCEKHQLGDWVITEATCEEDGSKVRTCTVCQYKEELVLNKTGHAYESEVTVEATEEAEGTRTFTCKNCEDTYTESIPKLPSTHEHKYEETITKNASCELDGEVLFKCSCGDQYTDVLKATGHSMNNGHCQNCGIGEDVKEPEQGETGEGDNDKVDDGKDDADNDKTDDDKDDVNNDKVDDSKDDADNDKTDDSKDDADNDKTDDDKDDVNNDKVDDSKDDADNDKVDDGKDDADNDKTDDGKDDVNNDKVDDDKNNNASNDKKEDDKKDENDKTPSESDKKPEETVKNPTSNENKTDQTPSESDKKSEETVKNPTSNENKTDQTPSESDKKPEETVVVNKAEIELMSNLVEMADKNATVGEKQTVIIQMSKNTEISQRVVELAKEHGVDLEVSLPNDLKWTIKADSLGENMPSSINLNAQIVSEVIEKEVINTVVTGQEYMELSLSHDGVFGFEATLTIPVEEKYVGQTANLFYFNEKTKELEFVMAAPVDENGNVALDFNHASDYVIVFAEKTMEDVVTTVETLTSEDIDVSNAGDKAMSVNEEKVNSINKLITICVIILVISGLLALIGLLLYKRGNKKEENEEISTFEEWLKEDVPVKDSKVNKVESKMSETINSDKKSKNVKDEYFDDEQDDYREKEIAPTKTFHTGEIVLEEDYLDEEDDYAEEVKETPAKTFHTGEIRLEEDYLDEDVDDYKEK